MNDYEISKKILSIEMIQSENYAILKSLEYNSNINININENDNILFNAIEYMEKHLKDIDKNIGVVKGFINIK